MYHSISPWQTLGITATQDARNIKRAYAKQLKTTRPDECPVEFQTLRQAYEQALQLAKQAENEDSATAEEVTAGTDARAEEQLQANQPVVDHRELARQQLAHLLSLKNYQVTAHLKELLQSDALLSLSQRDAFELAAFAYCGQPDAAENIVKLFFATFDWDNHLDYLARMDQALVHQVLQQRHEINVVQHANRLWRDLFAAGVNHADQIFQQMVQSGALSNFAVNLAFQQHAIRYCAGVNVNHELAATLIKAFEWGYDVSHLDHEHQELVNQALLQHQNWCDWKQLQRDAIHIPELSPLLGQKMPGSSWSLWDKGAVVNMKKWVNTLREKYPAVLQNDINPLVFEAWARQVDAKRYFLQTFLLSLLWGIPFAAFLAACALLPGAHPLRDLPILQLLLAGEASSVIIIAWLTLSPPVRLTDWWQRTRAELLSRIPWFSSRHANSMSIALFGLYGLCLLPPPFGSLLPTGWRTPFLLLDFALLLVLLARDVPVLKWCLTVFAGAVLYAKTALTGLNAATCGFLICLILTLCRGSMALERLYLPQRLQSARQIWLLCAFLLFMLRAYTIGTGNYVGLTHPLGILALGCLCLAGLQLGEFYLHTSTFSWLIGTLIMATMLFAVSRPPRLMPELTFLITLSSYISVVIGVNLFQASEHPRLRRSSSFT